MKPLPLSFFRRPAEIVARDLLGATVISTLGKATTAGIIVETEAYLGFDDPAAHAYRGRRHPGNLSLYQAPGTWYVYRSYGIHWCANLVCLGPGEGSAVLLRGITPAEGHLVMRKRRGGVRAEQLANGPGKLCQALGITRALDGQIMAGSRVRIHASRRAGRFEITTTPRIGITKASDWPLRFVAVGLTNATAGER